MLKFFRRIRQNLLNQNRFKKYLVYAIGEIILVMIGILLALQVNNWNQKRIEKNEETEIITKLHTEFQENKKNVDNFIEELNNEINAQITLMNLIGVSKEELFKHNLDSLFFSSFGAGEVAFADNTIKNIIQSGKLNVLKNEKISALLIKWNALSEIRQARLLKLDDWVNDYFTTYLLSKISFKEMDANGNYKWGGTSKIKPDYYPLFQEIEFENYLDNSLWFHQQLFERCIETDQLIDEIIEATKPND